jgi:hypothetical protein
LERSSRSEGKKSFSWVAQKAQGEIKVETGAAALVLGGVVVIFAGFSAIAGTVLSSVAHVILEPIWGLVHKLNFDNLLKFLNARDVPVFREHFERHFGKIDSQDSKQFKGASVLCSYFVFCASQSLGTLSARHDAEGLSAQSMVLASLALCVTTLIRLRRGVDCAFLRGWLVVVGAIFLGSVLTYNYHRKKKVYSRFGLYFASSGEEKVAPPPFE